MKADSSKYKRIAVLPAGARSLDSLHDPKFSTVHCALNEHMMPFGYQDNLLTVSGRAH